jgi:N-acetylmuramic acid 6-phosphate etherase
LVSTTESISQEYIGLDSWNDDAILYAFSEGHARGVAAVKAAQPALARACREIVARIGTGSGRIIYVGAGASGLIAALDGKELRGTFGWPDERVAYVMPWSIAQPDMQGAGEDDAERGRAMMVALTSSPADVVIAVTASGSTPYTLAATAAAREAGALTVGLANNAGAPLLHQVDVPVLLDSGTEVIVGSTRMNAGTAQKAALGMISSLVMIRLGHIYDGMMVNLRVDNAKLRRRAIATLAAITDCAEGDAAAALDRSGGKVKTAALMLRGLGPEEAARAIDAAQGNLRTALAKLDLARAV